MNKLISSLRFISPRALLRWTERRAETKQASSVLFWHAFFEATFFPIPPDITLMTLVFTSPHRWRRFALIATIGSAAGGIAGYLIGFFLFESVGKNIINFLHLNDSFARIEAWYALYAFWVVFVAGFTPIPYKVFTIAAGLFEISFFQFVIASILSRGLRFLLVGIVAAYVGDKWGTYIYHWINFLTVLLVLFLVLFFIFF